MDLISLFLRIWYLTRKKKKLDYFLDLFSALAAATTLKNKGVHVFCVGIGNAVKEEILNQIATSSSDTFLATDFDRLPQIEKELTTVICNGNHFFLQ